MIATKILLFFFALTISGNARHEIFDGIEGRNAYIEDKEISISMRASEVYVVLDGKSRHQVESVVLYEGCLNFIFKRGKDTPNGANGSLLACETSVQLSIYRWGQKHTYTISGKGKEEQIVEMGEINLDILRERIKFARQE